ncbi:MAG: hypothetical protein AAGB34_11385 [Planctomycetota bacterium]
MNIPGRVLLGLVALTVFIALSPMPGAAAQEELPIELRQQIDRLNQRIAELEEQLTSSDQRVMELEAENAALRAELAARQTAPANTTTPTPTQNSPTEPSLSDLIDPAVLQATGPRTSPTALLRAVQSDYERVIGVVDLSEGADAALRSVRRELLEWIELDSEEAKAFTGPAHWIVAIEWITPTDDGTEIRVVTLDPGTGRVVDQRRLDILLPEAVARELETQSNQDLWLLSAFVEPELIIDTTRTEAGHFDHPPFVGPFVALGYKVDVIELTPIVPQLNGSATVSQ